MRYTEEHEEECAFLEARRMVVSSPTECWEQRGDGDQSAILCKITCKVAVEEEVSWLATME